jgi:Ca2+-binding RTX toxin-like protein
MARAEAITRNLLDISDDFSDLVHEQHDLSDEDHDHHHHDHHHHDDHSLVIDSELVLGEDQLHGGAGNDVLIGDDSSVLELNVTLGTGLAEGFEHFVEGVDNAAGEIAHAVIDIMALEHQLRDVLVEIPHKDHTHPSVEHHADFLFIGNDYLRGGDDNDLIIGDNLQVRSAIITLVSGVAGPDDPWQDWRKGVLDDDDWRDRDDERHKHGHHKHHHEHGLDPVLFGMDAIEGGQGDDVIWGDSVAMLTTDIARGEGLADKEYKDGKHHAEHSLKQLEKLEDANHLWLDSDEHGHHHHAYFEVLGHDHKHHGKHHGKHHHHNNGDDISGGEGDDVMFGQAGDDTLRGDDGDDWLIGGHGKDDLDGGSGKDKIKKGEDKSSKLRDEVGERLIDWGDAHRGLGLSFTPFSGTTLNKHGPNLVDYDCLTRIDD